MADVVHVAAVSNAPSKARGRLPPQKTRADNPSERIPSEISSETTPATEAEDVSVDELQDNGVHESTNDTINSRLGYDDRPGLLSTPERERVSIELHLDVLQSRLSDLAPADTALQERVDSLRATVN